MKKIGDVKDDYENSMKNLLLHPHKTKGILDVANNVSVCDMTLPICIELHITNLCNLKCQWCIDRKMRENKAVMPIDTLLRLLDSIQGSNIGITIEGGGEPTMHPDFDTFIQACHERDIHIGLITNGTKRLNKNIIPYFDYIRVSVDSSTPEEYKMEKGVDYFNDVISNLHFIRKYNKECTLGISYVLSRRNYQHLSQLIEVTKDIGLNFIRMRNVEENESLSLTPEMMEEVQKQINLYQRDKNVGIVLTKDTQTDQTDNKNYPCIAHSLRAMIVATGDVMMCSKRRHDPICLGNINEQDFKEIWNSDKRIETSKKLMQADSQVGCAVCRITKYNELFCNIIKVKSKNFV